MNLFLDYQQKIFKNLKYLEKKQLIKIPPKLKNITVEIPPKNQSGDISCNAAMILAKFNNMQANQMAEILKENFLSNFKEFANIDIAGPGFLNINFTSAFWMNYLNKIVDFNLKFGANKSKKKKI